MTPRAKAIRARFFARVECLKLGHLLSPFRLESEQSDGEEWRAECLRCGAECRVQGFLLADTSVTLSGGWHVQCPDSEGFRKRPLTNPAAGAILPGEKGDSA